MANFSDLNGRNWVVTLDVYSIKQIKKELEIDLLDEKVHETLQRIAEDIVIAIDVLYLALKEQLDTANISDVEFGRSLAGDCLNDAVGALVEALVDFFPNPRKREFMKKMWEKATSHMDRSHQEMIAILDDERIDSKLESQMEELRENGVKSVISGLNSIESPATSE